MFLGDGPGKVLTGRSIQKIRVSTLSTTSRVTQRVDATSHTSPFVQVRLAEDNGTSSSQEMNDVSVFWYNATE